MICRLCGSNNLKLYYKQGYDNQFEFYKCIHCSLVNLDLSEGIDQEKYELNYIDPDDMSYKVNKDQAETYQFIQRQIKIKGKFVDIGCGNGKLLQLAKNDGWDIHGLELSGFMAEKVEKHLGVNVTVANFLDFKSAQNYDLVTLRHVLEHLPDSILALHKIYLLLNKGGYAVLEFPNIEGISFKLKRLIWRLNIGKSKYNKNYVPGHCNEFSKKSFEYLLSKTGFELKKWITYSSKPLANFFYSIIPVGSKVRVVIQKV